MKHAFADRLLLVLWYCTAACMICGALYVFITGSALFSAVQTRSHVALAVDSERGVTYVTGSLREQALCSDIRLKTQSHNEHTRELQFTKTQRTDCLETGTTEVTFITSYVGPPGDIIATLNGRPLIVTNESL
ncbi:MAG: hypothetical protein RI911_378 [Candidatus Parcubacteria bacterium]|jgi:hypothetical protein